MQVNLIKSRLTAFPLSVVVCLSFFFSPMTKQTCWKLRSSYLALSSLVFCMIRRKNLCCTLCPSKNQGLGNAWKNAAYRLKIEEKYGMVIRMSCFYLAR